MKQIFVIIEGEYSDWNIVGYTDSEDEAMQICVQHNEKCGYDDWYYEAVDFAESPKQRVKLEYVHAIRFYRKGYGGPSCKYSHVSYYPESRQKAITKVEIDEATACTIVRVPLKDNDQERAKKIAQDAYYKYLYEKQQNDSK